MEQQTTIIDTDTPTQNTPAKKVKDPKKVKAGKELARKDAEAKKFMSTHKEKEKEGEASEESEATQDESSFSFSDINSGIKSSAAFVGAGIVLYQGWNLLYPHIKNKYDSYSMSETPTQPATPSSPATQDETNIYNKDIMSSEKKLMKIC